MRKIFTFFVAMLFAGSMFAVQYNAEKVTSVKAGGLYIFERNGHALINSSKDNRLQTTDSYAKEGLAGNESYVWTLESAGTDSFKIITKFEGATHPVINNPSKSAEIHMAGDDATVSKWKITFNGDVALFSTWNAGYTSDETKNRFLGEMSNGSNTYRAYASSNLAQYGHDFTVYELKEASDPYISVVPSTVDFGSVIQNASVTPVKVKVNFGNLTGTVSYEGLTAPFSAAGTLAASGDEITISADASTVGDYSQTLTIKSAADSKSATVTVTLKVLEPADPSAAYGLYKAALVEGDYIIYYNGYAMKNAPVGQDGGGKDIARLGFMTVTPMADIISGPDASIIWHIAKSGDYWTLYNAEANKYAGGTGKNNAKMIEDGTADEALWTVTVSDGVYEFENKARAAGTNPDNKWLRNNGTNGFACYATNTGKALSLYKKGNVPSAVENTTVGAKAVKVIENGQLFIIRDGVRYTVTGAVVR